MIDQKELTEKFSSLQIGVFNASMDAAIKQAKMFVGELIPAEKKAVVEALEKMKLEAPKRDKCEYCGNEVKENSTYTNGFLTGLYGYVYCSQKCVDAHIESK